MIALQNPGQLFPEALATTAGGTHQAADPHDDKHAPLVTRHIHHGPFVVAVDARRLRTAESASSRYLRCPCPHPDQLALVRHVLDDQRRKSRKHRNHKLVDITHLLPTSQSLCVTTGSETDPFD